MKRQIGFILLILCSALACLVGMAANASPNLGRASSVENYQINPPITSIAAIQTSQSTPAIEYRIRESAEQVQHITLAQRYSDNRQMRREQTGLKKEYTAQRMKSRDRKACRDKLTQRKSRNSEGDNQSYSRLAK